MAVLAPDDDTGEASICSKPEYAEIAYHWYQSEIGERPIDLFKAILAAAGLAQIDVELFVGQLRATMKLLREGRLRPLHEVKGPMRSEKRLSIFEVRLSHEYGDAAGNRRELHVRMYHVEPRKLASTTHGSVVIGLHMHQKDIEADSMTADQDAAVAQASDRFYEGQSEQWGLPES